MAYPQNISIKIDTTKEFTSDKKQAAATHYPSGQYTPNHKDYNGSQDVSILAMIENWSHWLAYQSVLYLRYRSIGNLIRGDIGLNQLWLHLA